MGEKGKGRRLRGICPRGEQRGNKGLPLDLEKTDVAHRQMVYKVKGESLC